ncbi:glycosyl transferase family 2 [Komagataeibacter nataicola]|uniref:Glycosyl transferase family 2 n=1 Tax=Komagataeibacter nataicola TaxID=265960 RepID=A0A9N7H2G7_9PROT|nr:glycosyltransferase family 2 protein [Komagataeibacter nataicola]AQU87795.1 glycosyl transferase family 2 [Komagataeibacter nataicola]PYD66190.1 glycosyl transferase family 2 [Komagataeibacter nataicola]WEQ55539.1 glycosyltransferase family 2 protein [Komagataeibacter nataicola]
MNLNPSSPLSSRIAVLIPCYNEEVSIERVIEDFKKAIPEAEIYVYDNNSTDRTAEIARQCGAYVRQVGLQGKGYVVCQMFADIDADYYVLVDGDATYEAAAAPRMVSLAQENCLDMVNGVRVTDQRDAYRPGHVLGNMMLTGCVTLIFGHRISDLLSGYRVFSRRYVRSFPIVCSGFEIETFLSVHALEMAMPIGEVVTKYVERPAGSSSKLKTYQDGFRILLTIINLVKMEKPLFFFSIVSAILSVIGLSIGIPVTVEFMNTHMVPKLPRTLLAMGLMILAGLSFVCGLIMDMITLSRKENKRLAYIRR